MFPREYTRPSLSGAFVELERGARKHRRRVGSAAAVLKEAADRIAAFYGAELETVLLRGIN